MSLDAGTKLGPYEILGPLGAGGMGEVYRARDARLGRDVALKVLPAEFTADAERLARFEREAKVLASLNHPNIATIHGLEEAGGVRALVLELVEGEDLAQRIARGPIPVDEALPIARQIAEALEAAHEAGIVHRDLKPANVKATSDGRVKVLDFGLAKAFERASSPAASRADPANTPTVTSLGTVAGVVLGTAAYMSPEQARGKVVDRRADIWSFGVVLFEMLTGRRLFDGETVSDSLAAVLRADVDFSKLPPSTPAPVRALLARCLDRDPQTRLRDAGEARIVLAAPYTAFATVEARRARPSRRTTMAAAAVATLALVAGVLAGRFLPAPAAPEQSARVAFDIALGDRILLGSLAVSPDGRNVVFSARTTENATQLWLRPIDALEAHALPGTLDGRQPFWSPDGREIGFFAGDSLYRLALDGTTPRRIAAARAADGGAWGPDGTILLGNAGGPIFRVRAEGGTEPVPVTEVEKGVEQAHVGPVFMPDGRRFLFMADASTLDGHRVRMGSLDGGPTAIVIRGIRSMPVVDPRGRLLVVRDTQLVAYPFDLRQGKVTGEAVLVADGVATVGEHHHVPAAVSENGVLVYQSAPGGSALERMDLAGKTLERLAPPARLGDPAVSPSGKLLAYLQQESADERRIWVQDLERKVRTAISERGKIADDPTWSATDDVLYFDSNAKGSWTTYRAHVVGGGSPETIGAPEGQDLRVLDCSADNKMLLVAALTSAGNWDLYVHPLDPPSAPWTLWLKSPGGDTRGVFSPDSRSIAYISDTSGRPEIYVAPVVGGPEVRRTQISATGGSDPHFSADGRLIFYRTPADEIVSVEIDLSGPSPKVGNPQRLFSVPAPLGGSDKNTFAVARDGKSLIVVRPEFSSSYVVHVKTAWPGEGR